MLRTIRIFAALLVVTTMLLSQWAVAAHSCPKFAETAAAADSMMPCHDAATAAGAADKALCKQHCTDDHRTVVDHDSTPPLQFVPAFVAPVAPFVDSHATVRLTPDIGLAHALGPPPTIAHCRLRI
jgi:hypothetical protein